MNIVILSFACVVIPNFTNAASASGSGSDVLDLTLRLRCGGGPSEPKPAINHAVYQSHGGSVSSLKNAAGVKLEDTHVIHQGSRIFVRNPRGFVYAGPLEILLAVPYKLYISVILFDGEMWTAGLNLVSDRIDPTASDYRCYIERPDGSGLVAVMQRLNPFYPRHPEMTRFLFGGIQNDLRLVGLLDHAPFRPIWACENHMLPHRKD